MAYFSKGDVVTVREDLRSGVQYNSHDGSTSERATQRMIDKFAGKIFEIESVTRDGSYVLDCPYIYVFTDEMFQDYLDDMEEDGYDYFDFDLDECEEVVLDDSEVAIRTKLEYLDVSPVNKETASIISGLEKANYLNIIDKMLETNEYKENPDAFQQVLEQYNSL